MNVGTYIHARVFHSTTAATKLAMQNPQKYSDFAAQLIAVKNTNNEKALAKASTAFEAVKLTRSEFTEVHNIRHGSRGGSEGAVKGAANLLEKYANHMSYEKEISDLQQKQVKYDSLSSKIFKVL